MKMNLISFNFNVFTIIISITLKNNFTKERGMMRHISYIIIHVYEYLCIFIHIYTYSCMKNFLPGHKLFLIIIKFSLNLLY